MHAVHPCDFAYAVLVKPALKNKKLAEWLSTVCFSRRFSSLEELVQAYLSEVSGSSKDDLQGLVGTFQSIRIDQLEQLLQSLRYVVANNEHVVGGRDQVMAEERFGTLIRSVTRIVLVGGFEDLANLYNSYLEFAGLVKWQTPALEESEADAKSFLQGVERLETRDTIESIHSYYDHASRKLGKKLPPGHLFRESLRTEGYPNRKAVFLQHAVLELATAHHALGNQQEAFLAAREAVCISQQNLDETRLEASLDLFRRLDSSFKISAVNGTSTKNDHGRVEAANLLLNSTSRKPKQVLGIIDDIREVSYQNRKSLLRADAWEQFGHFHLATTWTRAVLESQHVSDEDEILAACRWQAAMQAKGAVSDLDSLLERYLSREGVHSLDLVRITDTVLSLSHSNALSRGSEYTSQVLLTMAKACGSQVVDSMMFENDTKCKRLSTAFQSLNSKPESNEEDSIQRANKLLQNARLFTGQRALVFALRAWALSKELNLRNLAAVAAGQVARARMEMGQPDEALKLLSRALPQVASHSPLGDFQELQLLQMICHINKGVETADTLASRMQSLISVLKQDQTCDVDLLRKAYYYSALLCHKANRVRERDEASELFHKLGSKVVSKSQEEQALCKSCVECVSRIQTTS